MKFFTSILIMAAILAGTSGSDVVIGILGNSVSIDCKLAATENIVWEFTSGVISINREVLAPDVKKYSVESYTGTRETLVIHNVTLADETEYRCYDIHQKSNAHVTRLSVLVRPSYMNVTYPTSPILEGSEVMLVCEAGGGKPLPEITWYTRDEEDTLSIVKGLESRTMYNNRTGHISSVLRLTATRDFFMRPFHCNVSVPVFYQETLVASLDIHFIPASPVIRGYDGSFDENTLVRLECISTENHPAPTIYWFINNTRASDTEYVVTRERDHTSTVTSYLNQRLSRDFDGTVVTCAVTNSAMSSNGLEPINANITLRMSYKPTVAMISEQYTVQDGGNVTLQCQIDALPVPDLSVVFWTHNGQPINKDKYQLMSNGSTLYLHLTNVSRADVGAYTCHAANRLGTSSDTANLSVTFAPLCSSTKPVRVAAKLGSTVRLDCGMYAYPTSVILFWRSRSTQNTITSFPAVTENAGDNLVKGSIDFQITDPEQYTTIECIGTNSEIGPITPCLYTIEPPSPAEAPQNCSTITSEDHVTVKCISGFDGGSEQTFFLQNKVEERFETIAYRKNPDFSFTSKENLTVRVCAMNEDFQDDQRCSSLLTANVYIEDTTGTGPVEAKMWDSGVYIAVGITCFLVVLILTAILILILRNKRKAASSDTSVGEFMSKRMKLQRRMNFGNKWWNVMKPVKSIVPSADSTLKAHNQSSNATLQQSRDEIQIVCSTPYSFNKQPDLQAVENSPILPEDRNVTLSKSTGLVLSPLFYQSHIINEESGATEIDDTPEAEAPHCDDDPDIQYDGNFVRHTVDDTKSLDHCAVTLYKDYSAGDIADVLDHTADIDEDIDTNTAFNPARYNSHFVINGTTLSFDVDYSESAIQGTMSKMVSPPTDNSEGFELKYIMEDDKSSPTTSTPCSRRSSNAHSDHIDNLSGDKIIMDQTFTVSYNTCSSPSHPSHSDEDLNQCHVDIEVDLHQKPRNCSFKQAAVTRSSTKSDGIQNDSDSLICTYVENVESHMDNANDAVVDICKPSSDCEKNNNVNDAFVDTSEASSDCGEYNIIENNNLCDCNSTLCDIDHYTLVITDESSMFSPEKRMSFINSSINHTKRNSSRSSSSSAHRNESFRTAIDNSAFTRHYVETETTAESEIKAEGGIKAEDTCTAVSNIPANVVDETFPRPFSAGSNNYIEESTLNLTTVINDVKDRTLEFL